MMLVTASGSGAPPGSCTRTRNLNTHRPHKPCKREAALALDLIRDETRVHFSMAWHWRSSSPPPSTSWCYKDCFWPFYDTRNLPEKQAPSTSYSVCRRSCSDIIVVSCQTDQDTASCILDGAGHPLQPGKELERQLDGFREESKGPFMAVEEMIQDKLSDIEGEIQQLRITIEQEGQVSSLATIPTMILSLCSNTEERYTCTRS